jgi:hypothetical protein
LVVEQGDGPLCLNLRGRDGIYGFNGKTESTLGYSLCRKIDNKLADLSLYRKSLEEGLSTQSQHHPGLFPKDVFDELRSPLVIDRFSPGCTHRCTSGEAASASNASQNKHCQERN